MAALAPGNRVIANALSGFQIHCCPPERGVVQDVVAPGGAGDDTVVLFESGSVTIPNIAANTTALLVVTDAPASFTPSFGRTVRVRGIAQEVTGIIADAFVATEGTDTEPATTGFVVVLLSGRGEGGADQFAIIDVAADFSKVATTLELLPNAQFPRY